MVCETHAKFNIRLNLHAEPSQVPRIDKWEKELIDDFFGIEEEVAIHLGTSQSAVTAILREPSIVQLVNKPADTQQEVQSI